MIEILPAAPQEPHIKTSSVHIDDQRVGVAAGNFAVNTGDHIGNGKWEMGNGEGRTRFKAASPS